LAPDLFLALLEEPSDPLFVADQVGLISARDLDGDAELGQGLSELAIADDPLATFDLRGIRAQPLVDRLHLLVGGAAGISLPAIANTEAMVGDGDHGVVEFLLVDP